MFPALFVKSYPFCLDLLPHIAYSKGITGYKRAHPIYYYFKGNKETPGQQYFSQYQCSENRWGIICSRSLLWWKRKGRNQEKIVDEKCSVIPAFQVYTSYSISLHSSYLDYGISRWYSHAWFFFFPPQHLLRFLLFIKLLFVMYFTWQKNQVLCLAWEYLFLNKYLLALKRFHSTFIFAQEVVRRMLFMLYFLVRYSAVAHNSLLPSLGASVFKN